MKGFAEILAQLSIKQRLLGLFLLLLTYAATAMTSAFFNHTDCSIVLTKYNALIRDQGIKDDQCEAIKQQMLATQAKMQEIINNSLGDMRKIALAMPPDTVLLHPKAKVMDLTSVSENGSSIANGSGADAKMGSAAPMEKKIIKKKSKTICPVCPVEVVKPNKAKVALLKKIEATSKSIDKIVKDQ